MKETIQQYEKSEWWKNYSKKLLSPVEVTCEICGKPHWAVAKRNSRLLNKAGYSRRVAGQKYQLRRFAAHHKHYRHPYAEKRGDLMVLCASCHETGHKLAVLSRNPLFAPVYKVWCDITGWESEENGYSDDK